MRHLFPLLLVALGCTATAAEPGALYSEFIANRVSSRLPDYSYAGYHRCEQAVPTVSPQSHRYFTVTDFGAIPNDGKSDRDAVVAALAAAHQQDGPAVVYFPNGNYQLFEAEDFGKPRLVVKRSNIVIKGSGVATTQLEFSESHLPAAPLISFRSSSGNDDYWRGDQKLKTCVLKQLGQFSVQVSHPGDLQPGMRINLNAQMDPDSPEAQKFYLPHQVPDGVISSAKAKGGKLTDLFELHEIKTINKDVVTFAEPIHLDIKALTLVQFYRVDHSIEECGLEDLSLRGGYRHQFKHHSGTRYGEDYRMIEFNRVFNSWVRRVRITDFSSAISIWLCGFNSFSDILLEGNCGHTSITAKSSYGNLFAYIREYNDVHHGLGVSRSGVNTVFLRCVQYGNMEAHCGYPRATLYDLNEGGFAPRGGGATFTPMHDKGLTFWNWKVTKKGTFDFWPEGKRYGYFLNPIIAGLHGEPFEIPDQDTDLLAYESPGTPTKPLSLFEAQLANRLGQLPIWLASASRQFERISRHSGINIQKPEDHSSHASRSVPIELQLHAGMEHVRRIDLLASSQSLWDGFKPVHQVKSLQTEFQAPHPGVWIIKAMLTNKRGEISFSRPITLHIGTTDARKPIKVGRATMLPGKAKVNVYQDFVKKGGGEAPVLPGSAVLQHRNKKHPVNEMEVSYRKELFNFYRSYGKTSFKPVIDQKQYIDLARPFFDGNTEIPVKQLYHYIDSMVQAGFDKSQPVSRVDIHWKNAVPSNKVRLEIQTSNDPLAWYSVVNDDQLWEFSTARIGGTLLRNKMPGHGKISSIYFPPRLACCVRLLFSSCPNEITEIKFH